MPNMLYKCYAIFAIIGVGKGFYLSQLYSSLFFWGCGCELGENIYIVCPQHDFLSSSYWSWLWTQFGGKDFHVMMEGYEILQQTCQDRGELANSGMGQTFILLS